jgi:hypothetical protein
MIETRLEHTGRRMILSRKQNGAFDGAAAARDALALSFPKPLQGKKVPGQHGLRETLSTAQTSY